MPIIAKRISNFLEDDSFKDEFSHTLLHNKDVFRDFQKRQEEEKNQDQQREITEKRKQEELKRQQEAQNQILGQMKKQKEEEEATRLHMEKM